MRVIKFDINYEIRQPMPMKNIYNPIYRLDYYEGYSSGLNPKILVNRKRENEAFTTGFNLGRLEFEKMNGSLRNGLPKRIVNTKILEDFLLAGLLGLSIDTEDYTSFQLHIILQWYQSGIEQYDPNQSSYLIELLEANGIEMS